MTSKHFLTPVTQPWRKTLCGFFKAATTVFTTPATEGHDTRLYVETAIRLRGRSIALQPPLDQELSAVTSQTKMHTTYGSINRKLSSQELLALIGILMQFTSYMPELRTYATTPFEHTESLYKAFVARGSKAPLSFSEQLGIALEQTSGDLLEAVWRLFITCRLYARWFDTSVISEIPLFSQNEIMDRMENWSRAVAACKPSGSCPYQDSSGDAYYCWTHALAKIIFKTHISNTSPILRLAGVSALHNGTWLNHTLAHKYNTQKLPSDHTIAARYGNAMGNILIKTVLS